MKEGDMSDSVGENNNNNNNNNSDHNKDNNNVIEAINNDQRNKIQPARSLQSLEHIVGSTPTKDTFQKCFVHIKPCYPFGIANTEEQMLVVTPDDDFSLYEDAVDTTPSDRLKSENNKTHIRKKQKQHHQHSRHHHDIPLIDRKVIFEQLPKIS